MKPLDGGQQSQQRIQKSADANLAMLQKTFSDNQEVQYRQVVFGNCRYPLKVLLVYCEGMINSDLFNGDVFPILNAYFSQLDGHNLSAKQLKETLSMVIETTEQLLEPLIPQILRGYLVIHVDGIDEAIVVSLSKPPNRQPEEPANEVSVRGPRDGFIEDLTTNVALVRKRLPTETLCTESFTVGERTQTKVSLLYIGDIIDSSVLAEIRQRINRIQVDAVYASSQLEELLSDSKFFIVPLFAYSGRPDFVVGALCRGRFAVMMDGVPTVIMGPGNLSFMNQTAEDEYLPYPFVVAQRCLRLLGLLITLMLPGFYVAIITYHQDQIPLVLLGTLATARRGTPFPTPIEALLMLLLFELLREAGSRLPGKLGQTLAIVGGLIIGDAAIDAGLTSSIMLAVIGITGLAIFTLPNQSLMGIIALFRFFIMLISSVLGEFGFLLASFTVLVYLSTVRSFGVPYLAPFSPFRSRDAAYTLTSRTAQKEQMRAGILPAKEKRGR